MDTGHAAESDELAARARRAQRRVALKRTHPDLGGTTEDFLHALDATSTTTSAHLPRTVGAGAVDGGFLVEVSVRGRAQGVRRRARVATRVIRNHLPRRLPGARRDITL